MLFVAHKTSTKLGEVNDVKKLDRFFFGYAGWWIRVAAFFGVTRWQLIVGWIYGGFGIYFIPPGKIHDVSLDRMMLMSVVTIVVAMMYVWFVKGCYREDNIFSEKLLVASRPNRLFFLFLWLVLSIYRTLLAEPIWYEVILMLLRIPLLVFLWPYFCLHQSPKDPVTLKSWVKGLVDRIRTALTPAPKPSPALSPT